MLKMDVIIDEATEMILLNMDKTYVMNEKLRKSIVKSHSVDKDLDDHLVVEVCRFISVSDNY
jgi:hypothetical protein